MRKFYLTFFIICITGSVYSQEPVGKITHNYFRSDPFSGEFSAFLKHLFNDPTLINTELKKRTDTSLFYFHGTYKSHNPFFFKPKRVEITLTEASLNLKKDSTKADTVYLYELKAFNDDTEEGIKEVKKEFERIHKRYKSDFYKNTLAEDTATQGKLWSIYNFFSPYHRLSPFGVSWINYPEKKEISLVITIRMDNHNNRAVLPIPLYTL